MQVQNLPSRFRQILEKIYSEQMSIIGITGYPKTGKTDFALRLAEELKELRVVERPGHEDRIITRFASNIETNADWMKHVSSLNLLKIWAKENREPKLFIYDEIIESTPGRRAMSTLNVEWLKFLPQISKAHMHVLALCQEKRLAESVFFLPVFNRGNWVKLSKKIAVFSSNYFRLEEYKLLSIPRTTIKFDPDLVATFSLADDSATTHFDQLSRTMQVAKLYSEGHNYTAIMQRLGLTEKKQIQRELQRICRILVTGDTTLRMGRMSPTDVTE